MNTLNPSRKMAARPRAEGFFSLFLLAGLLAVVTPLRADNPPTYVFQIDANAVPGGSFYPGFVALDSSNNVFVSDYNNSRVLKFAGNGTYLTLWASVGTNNGQFEFPDGIAVDSSNNIYVADTYNERIEKFDSNGNYLRQWGSYGTGNGQFDYPVGVAVDRSNNVYVTDLDNNRVQKFTSSGTYLTQWGSYGTGDGQFEVPVGIAVDRSNNVYVVDQNNARVEKFDSNGNYLTRWGSFGANNGQFQVPEGIAVDSSNNVYVTDLGNVDTTGQNTDSVEKFDSNGNYLTRWGSEGSGNGQFAGPEGIAVDRAGNFIYVADDNNGRIQVFVNNTSIIPPFIEQQPPTNQLVAAGINVTFSIGLIGAEPFSYQWNSNNVAVPGATNATFTLTNVSLSASGNYSVLVTNSYGSVLSSNAVLTVLPSLVTTQPASGISATGAVLNGSVTLGSDETLAWFDWGTDTNYGNIAGTTIVPGNNGSNNISAPLSGLPGNIYHYRLQATNDFGIVYGEDQLFTVGFAPSATTLPPTNGANGATLVAAVNPEGWDTIVYFRWGTPTLTNTTPGMDIGAGAASVNVSSFVPGLSASTPYQYQVVASNALGTAVGKVVFGDPNQYHYFFSGSKTNITLNPGTYIITAYGAAGGGGLDTFIEGGGGAIMSAEFNFSTFTTLTLLVGGAGGDRNSYGGSGNVSTNGHGGGGNVLGEKPVGGAGGTNGGGGAGGTNLLGFSDYPNPGSGGGGGGFLGNGGGGSGGHGYFLGNGGYSYTNGGYGGFLGNGYGYGNGGYGGGGGGGDNYANLGGGGGGGGYSGGGGGGLPNSGNHYGGGGGGGSIIDSSAIAILAEVSGIYSPDDPYDGEIIITAVPPPPLSIITDGANVVLIWPTNATVYILESTTNLVPPVTWQTNTTAPIVIGGQNVITNHITGSQQFFRLH